MNRRKTRMRAAQALFFVFLFLVIYSCVSDSPDNWRDTRPPTSHLDHMVASEQVEAYVMIRPPRGYNTSQEVWRTWEHISLNSKDAWPVHHLLTTRDSTWHLALARILSDTSASYSASKTVHLGGVFSPKIGIRFVRNRDTTDLVLYSSAQAMSIYSTVHGRYWVERFSNSSAIRALLRDTFDADSMVVAWVDSTEAWIEARENRPQ